MTATASPLDPIRAVTAAMREQNRQVLADARWEPAHAFAMTDESRVTLADVRRVCAAFMAAGYDVVLKSAKDGDTLVLWARLHACSWGEATVAAYREALGFDSADAQDADAAHVRSETEAA